MVQAIEKPVPYRIVTFVTSIFYSSGMFGATSALVKQILRIPSVIYLIHLVIFLLYLGWPDHFFYLGWISPDGTLAELIRVSFNLLSKRIEDDHSDISQIYYGIDGTSDQKNMIVYFMRLYYYLFRNRQDRIDTITAIKDSVIGMPTTDLVAEETNDFLVRLWNVCKHLFLTLVLRISNIMILSVAIVLVILYHSVSETVQYILLIGLVLLVNGFIRLFLALLPKNLVSESYDQLVSAGESIFQRGEYKNGIEKIKSFAPLIMLILYSFFTFAMYKKYKHVVVCKNDSLPFLHYELSVSFFVAGTVMTISGVTKIVVRWLGTSNSPFFCNGPALPLVIAGLSSVSFAALALPKYVYDKCKISESETGDPNPYSWYRINVYTILFIWLYLSLVNIYTHFLGPCFCDYLIAS
jgi:hypothetical protein